jgi:hypothetical protein
MSSLPGSYRRTRGGLPRNQDAEPRPWHGHARCLASSRIGPIGVPNLDVMPESPTRNTNFSQIRRLPLWIGLPWRPQPYARPNIQSRGGDRAHKSDAHLPGLDIEITHRQSPNDDWEQVSINLRASPSFEALGRFLEMPDPFTVNTTFRLEKREPVNDINTVGGWIA